MNKTPAVDSYILKSQPFAQEILIYIRAVVHATIKDVEETVKWGMPTFMYKGKIICTMAAFKAHASFGYWQAAVMGKSNPEINNNKTAMGDYGKLTSIKDLPTKKIIVEHIKLAMKLIDEGVKNPKPVHKNKKEIEIPDYFTKELKKNRSAEQKFNAFAYSHKKEYIEWITEAKTELTRNKRMATAIEWIAEGKGKNWKYERR